MLHKMIFPYGTIRKTHICHKCQSFYPCTCMYLILNVLRIHQLSLTRMYIFISYFCSFIKKVYRSTFCNLMHTDTVVSRSILENIIIISIYVMTMTSCRCQIIAKILPVYIFMNSFFEYEIENLLQKCLFCIYHRQNHTVN